MFVAALPVKFTVPFVVAVNVPAMGKGVPEPDMVIVPVPVVNVALAATVKPLVLIVGLLATPEAPAFVPSPMPKRPVTVYVPAPMVWGAAPFGTRYKM